MSESDFHRLGRTLETMLRLIKDDDLDSAMVIWNGLTEEEKTLNFGALAAMVNQLRIERGDAPNATYGPSETTGL